MKSTTSLFLTLLLVSGAFCAPQSWTWSWPAKPMPTPIPEPTYGGPDPTATAPNGSANRPKLPAGFTKIIFQDDFTSQVAKAGQLPDVSKWKVDVGTSYPGGAANWGTGEIQTYTADPKNLVISNQGSLKIVPVKAGTAWTSARIETLPAHDFMCPAGGKIRMEARLKLPSANSTDAHLGLWPAFWSLGSAFRNDVTSWPAVGEIDFLETVNGQNTVLHTAHCGVIDGGPCKEKTGLSSPAEFRRGAWTTISCDVDRTNSGGDWRAEKLVWYVDGRVTKTLTGNDVGDAAGWEALARTKKMLLLNMAVGGELPNKVSKVTTPGPATIGGDGAAMEVQYVAVYST